MTKHREHFAPIAMQRALTASVELGHGSGSIHYARRCYEAYGGTRRWGGGPGTAISLCGLLRSNRPNGSAIQVATPRLPDCRACIKISRKTPHLVMTAPVGFSRFIAEESTICSW